MRKISIIKANWLAVGFANALAWCLYMDEESRHSRLANIAALIWSQLKCFSDLRAEERESVSDNASFLLYLQSLFCNPPEPFQVIQREGEDTEGWQLRVQVNPCRTQYLVAQGRLVLRQCSQCSCFGFCALEGPLPFNFSWVMEQNTPVFSPFQHKL